MSNAIQLRDSSDVTTFRKNRGIYQNYIQLQAKQQLPTWAIPQTDLMAVARANAVYIPAQSLLATVTAQASCPACTDTVTYVTSEIAAISCSANCSAGSSYQPGIYTSTF